MDTSTSLERRFRVVPVQLPPPGGPPPKAASLTLRAVVAVALLAGIPLLGLLTLGALLGLNLLIWQAGRVVPALVIATIAVVPALLRGLVVAFRQPSDPPDEVELPESAAPELYAEVRALAEAIGTRPPDRVVMTAEVNAYVRELGPFMGLASGTRTLAIGAPIFDVLSVSGLRSVLAHELGHYAGGDTRLGGVAFRSEQALVRIVQSLGRNITAVVFLHYLNLVQKVTAGIRRGQEVQADLWSVRAAGRQQAADALRAVQVGSAIEVAFQRDFLAPLLVRGKVPDDPYAGWQAMVTDPGVIAAAEQAVVAEKPVHHAWDSHPPIGTRITHIAALPEQQSLGLDDRPSSALLRDRIAYGRGAFARWTHLITDRANTQIVPSDEWAFALSSPPLVVIETLDGVLRRMDLPEGLDGVRAALDTGRGGELAAHLTAGGWSSPDGTVPPVLRAALSTAAARRLEAAGATWVMRWSAPNVLRAPDGREIDLHALTGLAVDGDWAPLLEAVGETPAPRVSPRSVPEECAVSPITPPPSPPFRGDDVTGMWIMRLPGARKKDLGIGRDELMLGAERIGFDEICGAHVAWWQQDSMGASRGMNVKAQISFTANDGREVGTTTSAAFQRGSRDIVAAVEHLRELLAIQVAPRVRADVIDAVGRGQAILPGLTLTPAGITVPGPPERLVRWSEVGDPGVLTTTVEVPLADGSIVRLRAWGRGAFVLPDVVPALRTRYAG